MEIVANISLLRHTIVVHKSRSHKKRPTIIILIVCLLLAVGIALWFFVLRANNPAQKQENAQKQGQNTTKESDAHPNRIRLIATGDTVAHDSVNANAKQADGTYSYSAMMTNMAPIFSGADIRFCNQVTPAGGTEFGISGYPKFNAPTELVRDLGKLGCNTVNMASNHSFDVSQAAISANVAAWERVPNMLAYAGQNRSAKERDTVHYFTVKGVKFAFLAYTTYINGTSPVQNDYGVNQYSRAFADKQIAEAKAAGADVIIANMRWGTEYSQTINAEQDAEAQHLADQGVSLILGHGPHVLEPVKKLTGANDKPTYVFYSLGNFLNTQLEAEALFNGFAVIDYDTTTKTITNVSYLPLYMHYEWSAADAANQNLLARQKLNMLLLEDATDAMVATNQLKTSVAAQKQRIQSVLNTYTQIPLITKVQYDQ